MRAAAMLARLACIAALAVTTSCAVPAGATVVVLFDRLDVPLPDASNRVAGVDLDGLRSTGAGSTCADRSVDYVSSVDASEVGVDDALGAFLPRPMPGPALTDLCLHGVLALAVRIRDVDSWQDDDAVEVTLGAARVPGCDVTNLTTCVPQVAGGRIVVDQPMRYAPIGTPHTLHITNGRLRGDLGDMVFPATLLGADEASALVPVLLRGLRIDAAYADGSLDGAIGARVAVDDVVTLEQTLHPAQSSDLVRASLQPWADLEPTATDPNVCAALSIGLAITGVRVAQGG